MVDNATSPAPKEVRRNEARRRLHAGQTVLCPVPVMDLDSLEWLSASGFVDLAMIDMEHGAWGWRDIGDFTRLCDLWGVSSMVRVEDNNATLIGKTLDLGAQSILVPHVKSAEDASKAVAYAKYAPVGARGIGGPRQGLGVADYWTKANAEVMVGVILEDAEALPAVEAISGVDGLDFVFLAPFDLAQSMGHIGQPFHSDVQAEIRAAIQKVTALGRNTGTFVTDETVDDYLTLGARLLLFSPMTYLFRGVSSFKQSVEATISGLGRQGKIT